MSSSNNDTFSILLNANLNTQNIPQELKDLNAQLTKSTSNKIKIPVEIDGEKITQEGIKTINTFKDKVNNIFKEIKIENLDTGEIETKFERVTSSIKNVSTETQKFANESGALVTLTTTVDNLGQTVQTETKTYKNFGEVIQETTTSIKNSDGEMVQVGETLKDVKNVVGETSKSINKYKEETGATVTEIKELTKEGERLKTVIKEETDEQGKVIKTTELWNDAANELISVHKETINDEIKLAEQHKKLQQSLTETSKITNKLKGDSGELITTIEEIDKDGNKIFTTITKIDNGLGSLITKTEKYKQVENEQGQIEKQMLETHTETINDQVKELENLDRLNKYKQQLTTTTKEEEQVVKREGEQYKAVVKTIQEQISENETLTTTITTYKNKLGELVVETEKVNQNGEHVAQTTRTVTKELDKAGNNVKQYSKNIRQAEQETKTFGQSLSGAFSRLVKYTVAMLPIQMIRNGIREAITTIKEFDSALIEFRKVSDLAGESLTNYVAKLAEMGEITGSTMKAMVEASTEFRKSGFSDEDSAKLASIAEMYRNIADEEISAGESASFIIAQMKAFNIEADQAEHIIDAVNEVANNFSVSSADLATNLGNMSAIMAINNVSMEEQIGMLTGVTEITRNASSASRGLVMIASRLTQVLDDSSSTGKKLTAIYEDLGIELRDDNGQLRGHYEILGDLAGVWDTLSENEQKYIALTSAGARQQQNFVALMENWNQVAKATTTAYTSMGSAQKENEKVIDSVSKKIEILKSQFQQIVLEGGKLQSLAKGLLNIGISILKFLNSDFGKFTVTLLALEIATISLTKNWGALIAVLKRTGLTQLISEVIALKSGEVVLTGSTLALKIAQEGLAKALWETAAAWLASPMGIATVAVAAIAGIAYATYKYSKRLEDATNATKELAQASEQTKNEVDNLESSLKSIKEELDSINNKKLNITDDDELKELQDRTEELEKQERTLERQLSLQLALLEAQHKEETKAAEKALETTTDSQFEYQTVYHGNYEAKEAKEVLPTTELENAIKKYKDLENQIRSLEEVQKNESNAGREQGKVYQDTAQKIQELEEEQEKAKDRGIEMAEVVQTNTDSLYGQDEATKKTKESNYALVDSFYDVVGISEQVNEETQKTKDGIEDVADELSEEEIALQQLADAHNVVLDDLKAWAKELGISEEALVNYADSLGVSVEKAYAFQTQLKSWNEQIDLLQSSFDTLTSAVDEYNNSQELSLDTVQALLNLDPQYLACLEEENGQLVLNEQKIMDKVNALIEERKQIAINIAHERLRKVEIGESAEAEVDHQGKVENNTDAIREETAALKENTVAYAAKIVAESNGKKKAAVDKIISDLEQELSMLNKIGSSYSSISSKANKAGKSGKSGANAAKNAQKELNKELQETIKKYEQVIKYISKRYDREIKKLQDAEKDAVKEEEKIIKAKEKEKDHALDAIEKEIKALEKEKDALKEQKEALDERKEALNDEKSSIVDGIEDRIKTLEKERDAIVDSTQAQIDALNELKDKRKDYWDNQINALKDANKELKDNLELQEKLDALAKARNTKVKIYKEGKGFVYDVDKTAVAEAQKALDEYLSQKAYEDELARLEALRDAELKNYDTRLKDLNNYKDNKKKSYDQQIDALKDYKEETQKIYEEKIELINKDIKELEKHMDELDKHKDALQEHKDAVQEAYEAEIEKLNEHKDATQEAYEAEIDVWENYKQQFEDLVDAYEEQQNKLLFEQLTGIKDESNNWLTRLDNLAEFVRKYNELKSQLDTGNTNVTNNATMSGGSISGGGGGGGYNGGGGGSTSDRWGTTINVANKAVSSQQNKSKQQFIPYSGVTNISSNGVIKKHANGIDTIREDEIAIVGENPNREVVIGSKINNGDIMSLGKGTGVVNAESTKTLAGMLNQVGQFGSSGFGSGNGTLNNNINNDSLVVNGVTIEGSNIKDPETFVNGLLNLKAEALQRAYRRS